MKNKINIAELLRDCPRGMELDCTMLDDVTFERFDVEQNRCYFKAGPADTFWTTMYGTINGSPFGKCVIFPKGKTTWEGFLPPCQFKVGDILQDKDGYKVRIIEVSIEDECYNYESMIAKWIGGIPFNEQNNWQLVPNKFDITTLKPFDKVLVRENDDQLWTADIFGFKSNNIYPISCVGHYVNQCIPYEGNEHLLGTTNNCDNFYKTWE